MGQYWCPLTEACVPAFSPCSTYHAATESRRFASLPRYNAVPPFYHLVADLPFQIDPSPEFQTLNVSCVPLNGIKNPAQTPLQKKKNNKIKCKHNRSHLEQGFRGALKRIKWHYISFVKIKTLYGIKIFTLDETILCFL